MEKLKEIENNLGIGLLKMKENNNESFNPPKIMQCSTNLTSDEDSSASSSHSTKDKNHALTQKNESV